MLFGDGGSQRWLPIFFCPKYCTKDKLHYVCDNKEQMKDNTSELRALAARYKMNGAHFHKDGRGFIIVTRAGIEHICRVAKVTVTYTPVFEWSDAEKSRYVIECTAKMGDMTTTSYGECAPANNRNPYPVAMAEKRAMSRAVLKLTGFYELNAKGEDEIETQQTK